MLANPTNLILLGLVAVVVLRSVVHEMQRRRRVEWRMQILELLATATRRKYSLVPVLERAAVAGPKRLSVICRELARKMAEGVGLSSALRDVAPDCFPPSCLAFIEGAEGSGALADALETLTARTDEHQAIGYRMRVALTYPLILAVAFLGAHYVAERSFWAHTRYLRARGDNSGDLVGWMLLGILVLGVLVLQTMIHQNKSLGRIVRSLGSRLVSKTRTGKLFAAGEFLSALSHVVAAGIPLPAAIRRVSGTVGSAGLRKGVCRAAAALEEGLDTEPAWRRTWLPEFAIVAAAAVAQSSERNQAETLQHAALECRRRWRQSRERMLTLMPSLCVAVIGILLALEFAGVLQIEFNAMDRLKPW